MEVIILIGESGSGKSTWVAKDIEKNPRHFRICSADNYFYDSDGEYHFDPAQLGHAHSACLHDFLSALTNPYMDVVYIDNTNTTLVEIAPYMAIAQAHNCDVRVIVMEGGGVGEFAQRNVHGVPEEVVERQALQIRETLQNWPPFWPDREGSSDDV
jgi:hypothetical protein